MELWENAFPLADDGEMVAVMVAVVVVPIVLLIICLVYYWKSTKRKRLIEDTPTSKVKGVFIGLNEVKGTVELRYPLQSYLKESPCCWYEYSIEEHYTRTRTVTDSKGNTRTESYSGWDTVDSGTVRAAFNLVDDTGKVHVLPNQAEMEGEQIFNYRCAMGDPLYYGKGPRRRVSGSNHRRRFTESAIIENEEIYLLGSARMSEALAEVEIAFDEDDDVFMISTKSESELVNELNQIILTSAKSKLEEEDLALLTTQITKTSNRINLIGSTLSIPARTMAGEKFDWASLKGSLVVIDFWATWCGPCLAALPHLEQLQTQYAPKGVQFIGFSIDADRQALTDFLKARELKWPVIIDDIDVDAKKIEDDAVAAAWDMPSTAACGINGIPTLIVLDRTGTVVKMVQSAAELEAVLAKLTSPTPQDSPDTPAATDSGRRNPRGNPIAVGVPSIFRQVALFSLGQTTDEESSDLLTGNPYIAAEDADKLELLDYLLDMQDKVKSIRHRDGFAVAVHDAAARLLKLEASDRFHVLAVETACSILHEQAALGNEQLEKLLQQFVASIANDKRPAIQTQVAFHRLERRVLDSDELEIEKLEALLNDTFTFLENKTLTDSHLRIASAVVHVVNRYDDDEIRKPQFVRFGKLFSQSQSRTLASYGKKITKSATAPLSPSKLVGQQLELAGITDLGEELNWDSYRGKIVLIDFWASWCAPCRAQMPKIQALYEELDRKQFDVVAVNLDRDEQALAEYFKEHQSPWPNILGADGRTLAEKYNVTALPTMFVVDGKGKILGVGHSVQALRPIIAAALKK